MDTPAEGTVKLLNEPQGQYNALIFLSINAMWTKEAPNLWKLCCPRECCLFPLTVTHMGLIGENDPRAKDMRSPTY
jgi:hypothetical protein